MLNLSEIRRGIEEKTGSYNDEVLRDYFDYMSKHYSKLATSLGESYRELIKKESEVPENIFTNFLAVKEIIEEYEEALVARKLYIYALSDVNNRLRSNERAKEAKLKRLNDRD